MPEPHPRPLVLDTHVWLWFASGERDQMSSTAIQEIEEGSQTGEILVSAISVWEVAMLEARGRISLARTVEDWIRAALRGTGIRLLDLSPEIAIESTRLPGSLHRDPADRILVASARVMGGRLATRDAGLLEYARQGHLSVVDVTP